MKFKEPSVVNVTCRYCDQIITEDAEEAYGYHIKNIDKDLLYIEKLATIHLMQCKPFHEVKKSEIDKP